MFEVEEFIVVLRIALKVTSPLLVSNRFVMSDMLVEQMKCSYHVTGAQPVGEEGEIALHSGFSNSSKQLQTSNRNYNNTHNTQVI